MRPHTTTSFHPCLERIEEKLLLSAPPLAAFSPSVTLHAELARHAAAAPGYTLFRITNPTQNIAVLKPPFPQVLVQSTTPVPGQVYNILSVAVRNGTEQTFDAASGFTVRVTGQSRSLPVLTGSEEWKPGQFMVFYIMTKEYYPLSPIVGAGFELDLAGSVGTAIPGPSGIYLRVKYNPATIDKVINHIIAYGPGSKGHQLGLPDTQIWEFVSSRTHVVLL